MSRTVLFVILLISGAQYALALDSDAQQPVVVEADTVVIDELKNISTYSGNVTFQQGTMIINAEEVLIETEQRRLKRIEATGDPAKFRQRPEGAKTDVEGQALKLQYDGKNRIVSLIGNAQFSQGTNLFSGSKMTYDLSRDTLRAQADKTGSERVRVIIQPEHITGESAR